MLRGPVAIVGYMGSGKSTVGRALARRIGWDFVDLDHEIEARAGRSIPEIFASSGEDYFRNLENQVLINTLDGPGERVVACGGGIVVRRENRERLKGVATVFLDGNLKMLFSRTRGGGRPLRASGFDEFERRYKERLPLYLEVAGLRVSAGRRPRKQVLEEISRWLKQ